ncbi:MAG: energy-coupling factor transporter transmembrane protein EcfT [Muribaculaceae bacterium]|nr:energy-coupling factor transporter transmembrane protein EcfT [Muribaculaceae bacterium]
MGKIDKALSALSEMERGCVAAVPGYAASTRVSMLLTLLYVCLLLSVPLQDLQRLVWFASFPIVWASVAGIGYGCVLKRSLYVLPLILFVGIFNPLVDTAPAWTIGGLTVSRGWVSFVSVALRGMLAVQAVLTLTAVCGFADVCRELRAAGVPSFLTTLLQLVYRYMSVLLEELLVMGRARTARGFGRVSYPLRLWAAMAGQLFLRSVDRAERIHRAMLARGFDGTMPRYTAAERHGAHGAGAVVWCVCWAAVLCYLRFGAIICFTR